MNSLFPLFSRLLSTRKVLVTTPIFYVNSNPHIGHLYSALLADTFVRWRKLVPTADIELSTGTDEHGLKVLKAANLAEMTPIKFCDLISANFKNLFDMYNVNYDHYIRTTDTNHMETVSHFWCLLQSKGLIYKGIYKGWYSVREECFVSAMDTNENSGKFFHKSTGEALEWIEEENYIFKITSLQNDLLAYLEDVAIFPCHFKKTVIKIIDSLDSDISVSRSASRLSWGIDVPSDPSQKIYVWFDALLNYLTVSGYPKTLQTNLPSFYHIFGKDILRFHAVVWPAMLIGAGLEPPTKLIVHSHFMNRDTKMSKSIGNIIDPSVVFKSNLTNEVRYFLLHGNLLDHDSDYNHDAFRTIVNAELCNSIGNMLNRITSKKMNPDNIFIPYISTSTPIDSQFCLEMYFEELRCIPIDISNSYEEFRIYQVIERLIIGSNKFNTLLSSSKPWKLVMSEDIKERNYGNNVMHVCCHFLRICGIVLLPVTPNIAVRLLDALNIPDNLRTFSSIADSDLRKEECAYSNRKLKCENTPLLQRI